MALVKMNHPTTNLGDFVKASPHFGSSKTCIVDCTGDVERTISYREFELETQRVVGALRSLGIARGDRIAFAVENSVHYLTLFLGTLRLGAIPAPINFRLSAQSIRDILDDLHPRAILRGLNIGDRARQALTQIDNTEIVDIGESNGGSLSLSTLCERSQPDDYVAEMGFDDQAFQMYSSGSTGTPKPISMTHGGMLWGIEQSQRYYPVSVDSVGIIATPMYHKNAMRGTAKPFLRAGATFVIQGGFAAIPYLEAMSRYGVTGCGGVPAMYAELLRHVELIKSLDFSKLSAMSLGSAVVSTELVSRLEQMFPGVQVEDSYGLTEGGGPFGAPTDGRGTPRGSVGVVAPEMLVRLVNSAGQETDQGELWVKSPYVLKEYVNRPELNRTKLVNGWLRTGDLFRRDGDGFYYFIGRTDDMFVCGGENIYPREVEDILLQNPEIVDALVAALPHATKGHAPAALIVTRAGSSLTAQDVQDFFAERGPVYAVPRAIHFAAELPLTSIGKPDRKVATSLLAAKFGVLSSRREPEN